MTAPSGADGLARLVTQRLYGLDAANVARLVALSRRARFDLTRDTGATWTPYHRGYTNSLEAEGGRWTIEVGDTTRQEQQTELFGALPSLDPASLADPLPIPRPRVGLILGGPIAADPTYGLFASIEDFGKTRWVVEQQHDDQGPAGTTRVLRLKFVSGYLRPWYDTVRTRFQDNEWDCVNGAVQPYFYWDEVTYQSPPSATVNYFGYFPDLVCALTAVGGGPTVEAMPIARPVRFQPGNRSKPLAEFDALVGNDSAIYLAWGGRPWPGIGTPVDVTLFSRVISDHNPLLLAGHPIDLEAYAMALAGVPYDPATRVAAKNAIGAGHWAELLLQPQKLADFQKTLGGWYRYLRRPDAVTGQRQFVTIGVRPASSFAITEDDCVQPDVGQENGEVSLPPVWRVAERSVVNVVAFEETRLRRYKYKTDSGDVPVHMIATSSAKVEGARGDTSINGDRTVTFTLPGQAQRRATDGTMRPLTLSVSDPSHPDYPGYAVDAGGVLVDFAGWGIPETRRLIDAASPAASAQVGDEGTIDFPDLPVPFGTTAPLTTRGAGPQVVRVTKVSPMPGAVEITFARAGALSQDAIGAPGTGGSTAPTTPLAPTFTLAASSANPSTVATVTLTNGATLAVDNLTTELEYLAQTATPAPTDVGIAFGPETLYTAGNATTVDTPAVAAGSTVWARVRSVNPATLVASAWSAWASVALDPAVNGSTGLSAPTLTLSLDGSGHLLIDVTHPSAVEVKLAFDTAGPMTATDARAATAQPLPFASPFATGLPVAAGATAWVAAFAYDAAGNESQLAVATFTNPAAGGGGGGGGGGTSPWQSFTVTRSVASGVGPYTELGTFTTTSGMHAGLIRVTLFVPTANQTEAAVFHIPYTPNRTAGVFFTVPAAFSAVDLFQPATVWWNTGIEVAVDLTTVALHVVNMTATGIAVTAIVEILTPDTVTWAATAGTGMSAASSVYTFSELTPNAMGEGNPDNTVFLRGDRQWAVPPGGGLATVTADAPVQAVTTGPDVHLTFGFPGEQPGDLAIRGGVGWQRLSVPGDYATTPYVLTINQFTGLPQWAPWATMGSGGSVVWQDAFNEYADTAAYVAMDGNWSSPTELWHDVINNASCSIVADPATGVNVLRLGNTGNPFVVGACVGGYCGDRARDNGFDFDIDVRVHATLGSNDLPASTGGRPLLGVGSDSDNLIVLRWGNGAYNWMDPTGSPLHPVTSGAIAQPEVTTGTPTTWRHFRIRVTPTTAAATNPFTDPSVATDGDNMHVQIYIDDGSGEVNIIDIITGDRFFTSWPYVYLSGAGASYDTGAYAEFRNAKVTAL